MMRINPLRLIVEAASYRKGVRFERKIKEDLEREGAFVVRCAGSKPFDLVAFWPSGEVDAIECKSYPEITRADINKCADLAKRMKRNILLVFPGPKGLVWTVIDAEGIAAA